MARDVDDPTPITSRDQLVAWIEAGQCRPGEELVGTEHEKIPFRLADHGPVPYETTTTGAGIRDILEALRRRTGWEPITDGNNLIGLADDAGGGAISLEPGGQLELSGAPFDSVHRAADELGDHLAIVHDIGRELGIGFLDLGMSPTWSRAQVPRMPKTRYAIMERYMPHVGSQGLDMMLRSASVQTNVDFTDEADMVAKFRVSLAVQPLVTALFAASPFLDGAPTGLLCTRSRAWSYTDRDRTGILPFVFESSMGYERYVDWALDVPLYFVKRGEIYHDVAGASFRDLLAGRLPELPGDQATISDWENHLSTLFPEVRLKRVIEWRGPDMTRPAMIPSLSALAVGLLYHRPSLEAAWDLVRPWTAEDRAQLYDDAARLGLAATVAGRPLQDVARDVVGLARDGLVARGLLDAEGRDESVYLAPLFGLIESGTTRAEELLARFHGAWHGSTEPAFTECTV